MSGSFPGGQSNTVFPFDVNVLSALKGILDSFGNGADWVGVRTSTRIPFLRKEIHLRVGF